MCPLIRHHWVDFIRVLPGFLVPENQIGVPLHGTVCVVICFAVLMEHRIVTDRLTNKRS